MTRYGAKTDLAHAEIRDGLRELGFEVWDCHKYGSGFPDLLVKKVRARTRDEFFLFEIKSKYGTLKPREQDFFARFDSGRVYIVKSLEDAIKCLSGID